MNSCYITVRSGGRIMANSIRNAFAGFGSEMLEHIRNDAQDRLDDAAFEKRCIGIEKATAAMLEAEVSEDVVIQMLQKYWDLRLSEAKMFIEKSQNE